MKFRKKPVIVEAVKTDIEVKIETLEGTMTARPGDWIITGVNGESYPCKPDIFEKTYEPVEDDLRCGDCKQFIEPNECKDRATVYPDSPACEYFVKKGFWDKFFGS